MEASKRIDLNPPRLFLDSSVIFAGAGSQKGASNFIPVLSKLGLLRPVVCPLVFIETERNLRLKLPRGLAYYQELRASVSWEIVPDPAQDVYARWTAIIREKDAPILAAAAAAKPARLVTLDAADFIANPQVAKQSELHICTPGDVVRDLRAALASAFMRRPMM